MKRLVAGTLQNAGTGIRLASDMEEGGLRRLHDFQRGGYTGSLMATGASSVTA